jgi:hypothetical protein
MISDFELLGIKETSDFSEIKKAYHQKSKSLHPDTTNNIENIQNHYHFVEVCKAYERLCKRIKLNIETNKINKNEVETNSIGSKSIISHKDPAYVYYKTAIKYFEQIHPSKWKTSARNAIITKIPGDEKIQLEVQKKVIELVSYFPKAYYYFSIVVHEYPDSVWFSDSKDKLGLIEERMKRYKTIIESFKNWNVFDVNKKIEFEEMMKKNKEKYEAFSKESRRNWEKNT